jgi:hypothetical protein
MATVPSEVTQLSKIIGALLINFGTIKDVDGFLAAGACLFRAFLKAFVLKQPPPPGALQVVPPTPTASPSSLTRSPSARLTYGAHLRPVRRTSPSGNLFSATDC